MSRKVCKAVIPVAGLGTRFLPATKAMPKEMLPVVDKPAIQYVVEEAVKSGLHDLLMVTGRNKRSLEDHFDHVAELELILEKKGDLHRLGLVRESASLANIHYVRQGNPLGLGHAVLCARQHVGDEPFAVLLGDDLIDPRDVLLENMIQVQAETGGSVVALIEVDEADIGFYGCADIEPGQTGDVVKVKGLVEKPVSGTAPSNLAVIGRYVLHPAIFDVLKRTQPGRGNEIQLTDALQTLVSDTSVSNGVYGVIFRGRRYDTGDKLDYLKAVVRLASERDDLGEKLRAWLKEFCAQMD